MHARLRSAVLGAILAALGALLLVPTGSRGQALPASVQSVVDGWRSYCAGENEQLKIGANSIRRLDLSGDGRNDYLIDSSDVTCAGLQPECGSGGCDLSIFMQTRGGYIKVFDDLGGKISIKKQGKGYLVSFLQKVGAVRLIFQNGCAIDLAHGRKRMCKAAD